MAGGGEGRGTACTLKRIDLDGFGFIIVGLDWIGCYKFCFEFGLDEDFFSRTFFWIPTFGFWLPVHSKE